MSTASNLERQMLALINDERTSRGLQPLKLERQLNDSAEDHSEWMLQTDTFSHTGQGGSSATQRMRDAGFDFTGSWRSGENIAWQSERGAAGASDDVVQLHQSLMNSPGHRANILNPDFEYIGIGIEEGNFNGWDAVIVTQNFATTSAPVQLDTGGSGQGDSGNPAPTTVAAGTVGTSVNDWFVLQQGQAGWLEGKGGDDILVGQNARDVLIGGGGNDNLSGKGGNDSLLGGNGIDDLSGGSGSDVMRGQHGQDDLTGEAGDDHLYGGVGNDYVHGGIGNDILFGQGDDDRLFGADGNDRLIGGAGNDTLSGGNGSDDFVFINGVDRVTDFSAGDQVSLRASQSITNYNDLINNHITQTGNDVVISDGFGNEMILENIQLSSLGSNDFIF